MDNSEFSARIWSKSATATVHHQIQIKKIPYQSLQKKNSKEFESRGSVQDGRTANHRPSLSGDNVDKIKNHFEVNPKSSNPKDIEGLKMVVENFARGVTK